MSYSKRNVPASPILPHLTKDRAPSLGRRSPSRNFLQNSFNENDISVRVVNHNPIRNENISTKMSSTKQGSFKKKAPPPPIAKKPSTTNNKPNLSEVSNNPRNETLNKKLSTPTAFTDKLKTIISNNNEPKSVAVLSANLKSANLENHSKDGGNIKKELDGIFSSHKNNSSMSKELEGLFHKAKSNVEESDPKSENPKSEKTYSLTEVSNITGTWKTDERPYDDTLDFSLSDGFDTSACFDAELETQDDDDKFEFPLVLPPPPDVDFSDNEDSSFSSLVDSKSESLFGAPAPPSPTESLNSGMDFFIPPPPPPEINTESDDDNSLMNPPSLFDSEVVDVDRLNEGYSFADSDDSDFDLPGLDDNDFTPVIKTTEASVKSSITAKKNVEPVLKPSVPSINITKSAMKSTVPARDISSQHRDIFRTNKSNSQNEMNKSENLTNEPINDDLVKSRQDKASRLHDDNSLELTLNVKAIPNNIKQTTIPNICISELKNKIEKNKFDEILTKEKPRDNSKFNQDNNIGKYDINTRNLHGQLAIDVPILQHDGTNTKHSYHSRQSAQTNVMSSGEGDSGHSTAQSQDVSDTEKNIGKPVSKGFSSETLNTVIDNQPYSRESSTSAKRKILHRTSNASRTWSSCSSSNEDDYNETSQSKVNLREMLLKHMQSFESDTDDNIDTIVRSKTKDKKSSRIEVLSNDPGSTSESEIETHLNDVDVNEWTKDDVGEWLELIGLPHLKSIFAGKGIDGKALSDIDMQLLDEMKIDSLEDQELILSEIYALQNPGDEDLELSMLDALDSASGVEREKMLALINALQSPSNESFINNYVMSSPSSKGNSPTAGSPTSPIPGSPETFPKSHDISVYEEGKTIPSEDIDVKVKEKNKSDLMARLVADVYDPTEDSNDADIPSTPELATKKKSKRKGFFASLRRKGSKKSKSSVSEAAISMLSQSNPQGMVKILYLPQNSNAEIEIRLLVSLNTTSKDVCSMCLDYLSLHEDVKCFYIVISRTDKKVQNVGLTPTECPLMFQCKWPDASTYQFELKQKFDGYVIVNNEDVKQQEMISVKLGVSLQTTSKDIIPVLLKKFKEKEDEKNYCLQQSEKDERIQSDVPLLELPLHGYKFHVFKLVNSSPLRTKKRSLSFTEVKKMETKVSLLEKQIEKLTSQIEEYKRSEQDLKQEKQTLQIEVKRMEDDISIKNEDITKLQDELLANKKLNQRTPQAASPNRANDKELRELKQDNKSLKTEIENQKFQIERYESNSKSYKELKTRSEKECESSEEKYKKLERSHQDLKERNEILQNAQKNKSADSTDQMKKLYTENKEYLKRMRILEDKLSEAEDKLSHHLHNQESDSVEVLELRARGESLEHQLLEKDSKILELDYKIQKKERDIRELEDQLDDEQRRKKKESESKTDTERKNEDLLMKMDNMKNQQNEREKQLQTLKNQLNKQEKKLTKQKIIADTERNNQHTELQISRNSHQEEMMAMEGKLDSLQKLIVDKDLNKKQREFDNIKEKEELTLSLKDLERKLSAKDVIIERLENKIAKADLNVSSQLENQHESLKIKEENIQQLEMEMAKLESDHASKLREMSNTLRSKEAITNKLEARLKKIELSNREGTKKFEKFISEKDRLLQQVNADRDKESKELKTKLRKHEEELSEKDKMLKDFTRKNADIKSSYDSRLKKRDKEYKQQKYLLEKVLELVNLKAPSLLRHIQDSLDEEEPISSRSNTKKTNKPTSKPTIETDIIEDDWC